MQEPREVDVQALRFGGIARLYGQEGLARLQQAHVMVIGIGGVGSWTAEAVARSGVGRISLVDLDEVCVSNTNRQLHATVDRVGQSKIEVMRDRLLAINPDLVVDLYPFFYSPNTASVLLEAHPDVVIDCFDAGKFKAHLIWFCREAGVPVVTTGGAGGRVHPELIQCGDLSVVFNDPLLARVRKKLRQKYGFPRKGKMKVACVFSPEAIRYPQEDGSVCHTRPDHSDSLRLDCSAGYGTASFVTGSFGFFTASVAVNLLVKG